MIGSLFAGTDESPGETILYQGRTFKSYRGMGSTGRDGAGLSRTATRRTPGGKLVPEGIEGRVPYKGLSGRAGLPAGRRPARRAWATAAAAPSRELAGEGPLPARHRRRPAREPRARRDHHEGSSELPAGVDRFGKSAARPCPVTSKDGAGGAETVLRRRARFTSEDIHRVLFPKKEPQRRTVEEMKEGIRRHVRERYANLAVEKAQQSSVVNFWPK